MSLDPANRISIDEAAIFRSSGPGTISAWPYRRGRALLATAGLLLVIPLAVWVTLRFTPEDSALLRDASLPLGVALALVFAAEPLLIAVRGGGVFADTTAVDIRLPFGSLTIPWHAVARVTGEQFEFDGRSSHKVETPTPRSGPGRSARVLFVLRGEPPRLPRSMFLTGSKRSAIRFTPTYLDADAAQLVEALERLRPMSELAADEDA